jgi:pyridinium-3,5-biscarboxylic acid mononucleotide synthase
LQTDALKELLIRVSKGDVGVDEALQRLKALPFEDVGFACIDHHRGLRRGLSEVIFGEGKEPRDIVGIMERMVAHGDNVLVTRLSREKAPTIQRRFPESIYQERARILTLISNPIAPLGKGTILVVSAGTSDIPVAEEAAITARFMGNEVDTIYDVGISGLHRILNHFDKLVCASVIIVVAGMEGALPSIGYGASFHGVGALLGMLNSCASGVTVVNIDNGFGAGYAAAVINRLPEAGSSSGNIPDISTDRRNQPP